MKLADPPIYRIRAGIVINGNFRRLPMKPYYTASQEVPPDFVDRIKSIRKHIPKHHRDFPIAFISTQLTKQKKPKQMKLKL